MAQVLANYADGALVMWARRGKLSVLYVDRGPASPQVTRCQMHDSQQRRILHFFERSRGIKSMREVYQLAESEYPNTPPEQAVIWLYQYEVQEARIQLADVGYQVSEAEEKSIENMISLQHVGNR